MKKVLKDPAVFHALRTGMLAGMLTSIAFGASGIGDATSPACKAAEALSGIWGLIQVVITGVVVIGLLGGAVASFMERRGSWGIGLIFAAFVIGAVFWVALSAIGEQLEGFASSDACGGGA